MHALFERPLLLGPNLLRFPAGQVLCVPGVSLEAPALAQFLFAGFFEMRPERLTKWRGAVQFRSPRRNLRGPQ